MGLKKPSTRNSFFILLILIIIAGCRNNKNQTIKGAKRDTTKTERSIPVLNCDTTIVSQEFSYGALAFKVFKADTNKVKSLFLSPVSLKMKKQTNEEGGAYDLYNFTDGINKIILFRNRDGSFYIEDADIKNDKVLLNKKISIGMGKDAFLELLKAKNIKCDTVAVSDEESTFESIYIFKDARLRQVKMGQVLE